MNNIILIDDDLDYHQSFTNIAITKNINVSTKTSLEGLKELLPKYSHKFAAVVLDIKCLLTNDQPKEDASFIPAALKYLDSNIPGYKRFILTGDESEFDSLKRIYKDEKIFLKQPDGQQALLDQLDYCVQNAIPLRLRRENLEIFDAFDRNLLPQHKEQTVINILTNYNQTNNQNFRGIIGDIREIHEEIYKSISLRNSNVVPQRFINGNGSPIFSSLFYKLLQGNPNPNNNFSPTTPVFQDSTINTSTRFIHQTCSEFLHSTSSTNFQISHYTIKALINTLMEMIIWSKQY